MNQVTGRISGRVGKMQSPKFGVISEMGKYIEGVADVIDLGYGKPNFETPSHTSPQCSFYVYANVSGFGTSSVEFAKRLAGILEYPVIPVRPSPPMKVVGNILGLPTRNRQTS